MKSSSPESSAVEAAAAVALQDMIARAFSHFAPPPALDYVAWAEEFREMSEEETNTPGKYSMDATPALRGILMAASLPGVRCILCQKSAQVGYTAGVVCNIIGYHIHWHPSVQVAMFPRIQSGKDFASEKLEPMIRATPVLAERVNLKSRAAGNGTTRRTYPGGLYKLVASNSASEVKSTSGRIGIVEEPDDANRDVHGQGDSIALVKERVKTYAPDELVLIGGTPTALATSLIVQEMRTSDQRYFHVTCHDCGEAHRLDGHAFLNHVTIPGLVISEEDLALPQEQLDAKWPKREVYGRARWEDAYYSCPHCGSIWTDGQRIANIRAAASVPPLYGWVPTAQSDIPGFYLTELLSAFEGSYVAEQAKKYLKAKHAFDNGDPQKLVAFWNSTLGLPWEYRGELPEDDELRERAENYAEWSTPAGGLVVILTVDVQHDRLAVTVWAVGPHEQMWLAYWGELHGRTIISHQGAWLELEQMLTRAVRHPGGVDLTIAAVAIDSGDGQTSEAVYDFCRKHNTRARPVLATKGASDRVGRVEIWTKPKPIDPDRQSTKAARMGVLVHVVGSAKAKDTLLGWAAEGGRVRLTGNGPGRLHWYRGVRDDWFEQLLSELKIPSKRNPRVREWTERTDRRNEGLDCTVLALWLIRHLRLHLLKASQWEAIESRLRQATLLMGDESEAAPATGPAPPAPALPPPSAPIAVPAPAPAAPAPIAPAPAKRKVSLPVSGGGISLGDGFRSGGRR